MSRGVRLPEQIMRMFPTPLAPRAHDSENTAGKYYASQKQEDLTAHVAMNGGQLSPDWVSWLMGFPIGWAGLKSNQILAESQPESRTESDSLKASETPKFPCKPQQPGDCSEANK
jgi:hypothetical protein